MKQGQAPLGRRATAWAVGLALAVLVMLPSTTLGIEAVEAPVADGCGELVEVPDTDRPYTRYEDMRSHPDPIAIRDERIEAAVAEARARGFEALLPTDDKGLGSVYRKLAGGGELLTYLSRAPLGARDTEVDLLEGGGVVIVETKGGKGHDVASVRRIYGDAAATILIGPYEGVLAHGDEIAPGLRSYGL
ncbi:MAG: hypothetical protein U9O18_00095, partial [Chloroflexota bacterium]|nr:hypothetical protein [Chloroflexota bacterium]